MNTGTDPFMITRGIGTYFEQAVLVADKTQTTYYSIINPVGQTSQYLSTPYVNSIAGTGTPGAIINGQAASRAALGAALSPAATDSRNIFIGSKDLGWKIQQIGPSGTISTIAGNYRYFYGDGRFPLNAALGPKLAVSVSPTSQVVITDISNVRLRIITPDPVITTIAGTGASGYSGDEGLAYTARFSTPTATATDMSGGIYIADRINRILRRISDSTITTYAGTPLVSGSTGDGGPATAATLGEPFGLAINTSNTVYFTDLSNCAIREVTTGGVIQRIAGTYVSGYGGDGGLAVNALLSTPRGIAVDTNNNIFFCDTGNSRIRRIDAATQIIETIAGNGTRAYGGDGGLAINASLSTPTGIGIDLAGNVYVADTDNQCVRYINMATQRITTVAGKPRQQGYAGDTSFATFALLNSPSHIAVDRNSGYYYIADEGNSRIRYVDPVTRVIYTAAGNGSPLYTGDGGNASAAVFGSIACLTRDSADNLYVVDDTAHTIRVINLSTNIITAVTGTGVPGFSGEGGLATLARISSPQTIVVDSNANLYFTDRDNQRIRKITAGGVISTLAGTGVAGYNGDSISSISANLSSPTALAIDRTGSLYVADVNNNRIRKVGTDPSSIITDYAGSGIYGSPIQGESLASTTLGSTTSLAVDSNLQVYFTDVNTHGVWKLNSEVNTVDALSRTSTAGSYLGDAGPLSNAYFNTPTGITIDASGNYVISDQGNSRLRRTYTFGNAQTPVYLTMNLNYTNYFASTGTAYVSLNGNLLTTFYGANMADSNFQLTNANIYTYPLQSSNPIYNDQTPYVEIGLTDSYGYTKLDGSLFAQQVPSQGLLNDSLLPNSGIVMNSGYLSFPNQVNGITIDNRFNDASLRSVLYTGQLLSASDPALKEEIQPADMAICYSTLSRIPLKRYKYIEPYMSTFRVHDVHRLGFLTTDVAPFFPHSVQPVHCEGLSIDTLDVGQIKLAHYGVTQYLQQRISTLEAEVEQFASMRILLAQRNAVL
jgi:sugar lactone lactonase YvrE